MQLSVQSDLMQQTLQSNLSQLKKTAEKIVQLIADNKVLAFYGEMGAGKTTLIKEICSVLKCIDNVSSPTFSIVNEYNTVSGEQIFHFDFYRIKNIEEAYDLGYEDYFYSKNYCLIEWPEKIEILLPENAVKVLIKKESEESRTITIANL